MALLLGLGTILKVDDDDSGSVYTTVVKLFEITPPSRVRERVDGTALEDTLVVEAAGIELAGDVTFTIYGDYGGTQDTLLNTLFANKTQCLWQILYADAGTETFEAICMAIEPQQSERAGFWKKKVTLARQTISTFA